MFKLLKCSLSMQLLPNCERQNRNIFIAARSTHHILNMQNYDKRSKNIFGFNVNPRRNLSFLNHFKDFNDSIYRYITTTEPSLYLKSSLIEIHDVTGFSWWSIIIFVAGISKLTVGLPSGVLQQNIIAKINLTKMETDKILKEKVEPQVLLLAKRGHWTPDKIKNHMFIERRKIWKSLIVKNNCHPFKVIILSFMQFPIWLGFSYTLRDMVDRNSATVPLLTKIQLQTEGVWWNTDMTLPDDTFLLPIALFMSSMALIEVNSLTALSVNSLTKFLTLFYRGFSLLGFFVGMNSSLCLTLYWTTSLLFGLSINLILLSPKIRRLFRIPLTPMEVQNPYKNLKLKFKEKYLLSNTKSLQELK